MLLKHFNLVVLICLCIGQGQGLQSQKQRQIPTTSIRWSSRCINYSDALKKAYYAQVDLIRRGLPKIAVQAEYAWAINKIAGKDPYFRNSQNLNQVCIWGSLFGRVFDSFYRSLWALKYLDYIEDWHPDIHFIKFEKTLTLPLMSTEEKILVDRYWEQAERAMLLPRRRSYAYWKFPFPANIEVLFDPFRDVACAEYQKFGSLTDSGALDAHAVLIQLIASSLQLYYMGGRKQTISQMLIHFVAYCFDGIRCVRREDHNLKIPLRLRNAYARHIGFLSAAIVNPSKKLEIAVAAVDTVFAEEIHSLLCYTSWGITKYAKLKSSTSPPVIHDALRVIFDQSKFYNLQSESVRQIQQQKQRPGYNTTSLSKQLNNIQTEHKISCPTGYVYIQREVKIKNSLEYCCACGCEIWSTTLADSTTTIEACCSRCNAYYCPSMLTAVDTNDVENTAILVPQFGDQKSKTYRMLVI